MPSDPWTLGEVRPPEYQSGQAAVPQPVSYPQVGYQTAGFGVPASPPGYPPGYAGYPPPGYPPGYQPYPGYPAQPWSGRQNPLAIASLVVSLVALVGCVCQFFVVAAPVGAVLGHVARRQVRNTGERGAGMALAGIIVGWSLTAIAVVFVGIYALLLTSGFAANLD